ncbi:MAG TPA: hypothetical protein VFO89_01220 [Thermoanaerobaculia bacterium]|nr:hypothetical protein [Thermoanaerobaculia bacterium]
MRTSQRILLLAIVALLSLPALAQLNDTYVIPASGNVPGQFGTRWMTQFSIMNPHLDYSLKVSITYLPTGGGTGIEELVTLPPNSVAYSDNLLGDLFERSGSGSLLVATFPEDNPGVPNTVLARAFLVTSNTYNNSSSGTYGQTIPGVWAGLLDVDTDGITAVAHGIRNLAREGWRTNIGAVNLGRCSATVHVTVYDADGRRLLNAAPFVVPPLGHMQDRLPVEVDMGAVELWVQDPCVNDNARYAVVFPYTSTIDQLSGDPTYQSPALLALPGTLFAKSKASVDSTALGKKIDTDFARAVRAQAERRGEATLVRNGARWQISK